MVTSDICECRHRQIPVRLVVAAGYAMIGVVVRRSVTRHREANTKEGWIVVYVWRNSNSVGVALEGPQIITSVAIKN